MGHVHRLYAGLSGSLDGTNTDFNLPETPDTGSVRVFINGIEQLEDVNFTVSGTTVTFVEPPEPDNELFAHYTRSVP